MGFRCPYMADPWKECAPAWRLPAQSRKDMSFVNPLFFVGALAAFLPVLLHLIKRERSRKVEFPTLMFLRRVSRKTIRYQKLRHLLLLLLRVLTVVFLALAFTRPYRVLPQAAAGTGRATASHIVLLDNSLSMAYGDHWERARQAAAEVVQGLREGDKAALVEFSDHSTVRVPLTTERVSLLDEIQHVVSLTDCPTHYAQALRAAEKLALEAGTGRRVIHLISDFQKSGWAAEEQEFRLDPGIEIEPVDVGSDDYSNLTIGDVRVSESPDNPVETSGSTLGLKFSVINFGSRERKNSRISLSVDRRTVMERNIDLAGAEVRGMEFQLPGLTAGPHQIALEADDPLLPRDNRYVLTLETRGRTQVVAVEDPASARGSRAKSFFLSRALNVPSLSRYQLTAISLVQAALPGALNAAVTIWNDASGGSGALQKRLEESVKNGSGLILVVADSGNAADFNRSFGAWLPFRVDAPAAETEGIRGHRHEDYSLLTDLRLDHPIFRPFSEPHSGNFSTARFSRHARLRITGPAEVLARFDNGDPALVAAEQGKGHVLVFASSADDSANDLPLKAVYAPFWQQMVRFLDNVSEEKHAFQVGETIAPRKLLLEAALRRGKEGLDLNQAVAVLDPDRKRVPITADADAVLLQKAGFYEVRTASINADVAVNPVPRESDLAHGNAEEMTAGWLSPDARTTPVQAEDEPMSPEDQDKRQQFWRYLLSAALVFFVGEALLSNRFVLRPD